ncbi:MAG: hypothetical protein OXT73_07785 [Bacteroidota bacterium]|nr:hypothetical protein [Bacteroidota bacterium]
MRTFNRFLLFLIPVLLLVSACNPSEEVVEEWTNEPTVATAASDTSVFVVFGHEVRDYAVWKQVHTDMDVVREDWGITDAYLMQGADEDSIVWMMMTAPGAVAADGFMVDPNLARIMETEGVEGETYRAILASGYTNSLDPADFPSRVIVQHEVRDFDAWKRVFDGHVGSRQRAGLVDLYVSHPVDDSTDVHMMFGVTNESSLVDYMASAPLRAAMRLSGVVGEPRAYFVRIAD